LLGNSSNKVEFFQHKQSEVSSIEEWAVELEEIKALSEELNITSKALEELLETQNEIAKLKEELSKLDVEQSYFENNFMDNYIPASRFFF
jgi:predicted nuclease with TOPRIM domain